MKCINKFFCFTFVIILACSSLTGCGSKEFTIPYTIDSPVSSFSVVNNDSEDFASPFAASLCIANDDVLGKTDIDMTNATVAGLFDLYNSKTLYAKNIHQRMNPASITKIMTALVALKYGNMEDVVTISENIVFNESGVQVIGLKKGDQVTLDQLMHMMLIYSANDAAVAIADYIGGSVDQFAEMMNQEALSLGATESCFKNPHGLTTDGHYTTAYDLYLIFNEDIKYDLFNEIINMDKYSTVYKNADGEDVEVNIQTTNLFLRGTFKAPDQVTVIGGKTGTTNAAGHCLIIHSKDTQGRSYISVILQSTESTVMYQEMADLLGEI